MAINETPPFWFAKPGLKALLLWPFSLLYSKASAANMMADPSGSVDVPTICVGNFVVGGGGKTPTVIALAQYAKKNGFVPGLLSRGYSGKITSATQVDLSKHNSKDVGDEPLLLAQNATTVVSVDRVVGAKLLVELGCDLIIMDDGFQNPKLRKDYNLVVVDAKRGIGNGYAMPAGPLRVDLNTQFQKTDSVLIIGDGPGGEKFIRLAARAGKPIYQANSKLLNKDYWKNKSIIPFSGIADPGKFFDTLRNAGANIAQLASFPDHHFFTKDDAKELLEMANLRGALLVTTTKDHARLRGLGELQNKLVESSKVAEISLEFENRKTLDQIFAKAIQRFEKRKLDGMKEN